MTQERLFESREKDRLQKMTSSLGMSLDEKAKMREKKKLRKRYRGLACPLMKRPR
jgi:hypothetical protein